MRTKADEIKGRLESIYSKDDLTLDQEINVLMAQSMLELNSTLVFIKENTRNLERI